MTRHVVAVEGKLSVIDWFIQRGALYVEEETIPVAAGANGPEWPTSVGTAREFQRDEATGEISFEIETDKDVEGYHATIFADEIEIQGAREDKVVKKGRIRQILFAEGPSIW